VTGLVVDASVAAKWVVNEPDAVLARQLFARGEILAPELLWAELGSMLWRRHRVGELSAPDAREMMFDLRSLPVRSYAIFPLLPLALEIAMAISHSIYDCVYVALADQQDCRFVTADRRFRNKIASGPWAPAVISLTDLE
jgi:predicted nucleic acid-binding protein